MQVMGFRLISSDSKKTSNEMIVSQSNVLVEAKYYLSLYEQRLVLMMISMVEPTDEDFKKYAIKVEDFRDLIGLKTKNLYPKVKNLLETLATKIITIPKGGKNYLITGWISDAEYKNGTVYLSFSAKLKPYLLALKSEFTSHRLGVAIRFKGVYTIRIYTLLKQYQRLKVRTFEVEEFREILGIKEGKHKLFADLKRHTILKAKKEFSERNEDGAYKSDINFDFEPIKTGRKITGLKFTIYSQNTEPSIKIKSPIIENTEKGDTAELSDLLACGVVRKKALELLEQYGAEYIAEKIKLTDQAEKDEKIKSTKAGYLIKAITEDWKDTASQKKKEDKKKKDQARKKVLAEREQARRESAISRLEKTFRNKARKEFLEVITEAEKIEIIEIAKKEQPAIADMVKDIESPFCLSILLSKIPDYEKNKKLFINTELEKMGLISKEESNTEKK